MKTKTQNETETANNAKADVNGSADLKRCTVKREIEVGKNIPDETTFNFNGGGGWINNSSAWMTHLFERQLAKLQNEKYEFGLICRNENEQKAFYLAIEENLNEMGYFVEWVK